MASRKFRKRYPSLTTYLDAYRTNVIRQRVEKAMAGGVLGVLGGAVGGAFVFGLVGNLMAGLPAAVLGAVVGTVAGLTAGGIFMQRLVNRAKKPKNQHEALQVKAYEASQHFRKLDDDKKLHRWLDPIAGQLLEAGTYHWKRVHDHLNLPFWQSDDLPNHWSALREKSIEAADNAMAELVVLCSGCVGEPTKSRDDDLKDVIEDFVDLDIQDALQGLGRIVSSDDQAYSFHSPEAQVIFEPGRAIAERLKDLADQVEQASTRARSESVDIPAGAYSTESIDILLGEFRAVQQAEDELHQTQGQ